MAYILRQKVGNHVYFYQAVSYRNKDGKPRSRRVPIGKLDAAGQPVYKSEYIQRMAQAGTPLSLPPNDSYTLTDITESLIKDFGSFYLFKELAAKIGLLDIIQKVFPDTWREIFDLVCFIVSNGEPFMYCQDGFQKPTPFPQA
jgi:hypothetical protein